ncbi:MAG: TIGR00730 family Rossman fold protein [Prevotella sp.]|nr:TIGR00730 family Rossman fold protein [Prevotella sp.]
MKICIFCSANEHIAAGFFEKTEQLGRWCAANGHDVVFGGHNAGLMRTVSRACKDAGGRVIGIVPRKIEQMGRLTPFLDVHIPCEDLTDRKQLMMDMSEAFIVLPGGIGTLDELFTVCSCATLGYHAKPVIVYDMDGFWAPLASLLDHLEHEGMMRSPWRSLISVVTTLEEIADIIR